MENKKTIYHFIIDKSGSMQGLEGKTIRGFNSQLETLQKLQQEYPDQSFVVSLSFFNSRVSQILRFGKIQELTPLSRSMYQPSGSTALLDAIGSSIEDIRSTYGVEIDQNQASVVIMILTDGEENSSTLYTQQLISQQIKTLEETDKWTFTFLGAEIDAYTIGQRLNIKRENTMSFLKQDFDQTMNQMGCAMVDYTASKDKGNILSELFSPKKKLKED
jgi:hypothetical protein